MNRPIVRIEVKLAFLVTTLMIVSMWLFHGTTENSFVWDTNHYLFYNKDHLSSLSVENLWWMATSLDSFYWHPLTWFSFAVDYQLFNGLNPWGFHFSNNFLYAINAVLVFFLILTVLGLVDPEAEKFTWAQDNKSLTAAFLVSLLFVVHPQHVESVAWVAERKDLLFQFFLLLALLAYVKYVNCDQLTKVRWYLMTLSLVIFAALSKPMTVTFPIVLLLLDIYPLRRTSLAKPVFSSIRQQTFFYLLVEKIPFFLLSIILILTTLIAQKSGVITMIELPLLARLVNAVHSIVFYLEKFMIPVGLSPLYPYFKVVGSTSALKALLVFLVFSGITLAAILGWRKQKRAWLIAWLFYLVTLLPVLGLIQVGSQGAADRFAYFPTLPLYLLIAAGILLVLQKQGVFKKTLLLMTTSVVIFLFAIQTGKQIPVWQSALSLWTHVIKMDPNNKYAHSNLGIAYMNHGEYENAALEFEAAGEATSPRDSTPAWQAITYMHLGRYKESIGYLVKLGAAAETEPYLVVDPYCIQYNIGWNYAHLEMYQESVDLFTRVAPNSTLGADAGVWLNALSNAKQQNDKTVLDQELPGICENLIPSRAWEQGIR